jgi:glycine/D-amino acid oxidase-like deaminating enzyme
VPGKERLASADVVIIGAGIMGASIAFQLAKQSDRKIVVVDERPPVGGMSGRTFGQIRQHYSNALMVEMAIRGFDVLNDWQNEVGVGDPGYVKLGYMLLVVKAQVEACKRNVALGQSLGVDTRFASPDEIKALEPALVTADLEGGAWEPNGGYIDVTRMVLSWLAAAQAHGATLYSGLRVDAINTTDGRISGVATPQGRIDAPIVVNATGAWVTDLLVPLGIDIPIERRRLDMAFLEQTPGKPQIRTCITDGNSNVVMRPDMGPYVLAVAYPSEMPEVDDPTAAAPAADEATHRARLNMAFAERLPDFVDAPVVSTVSGAYDITPDFHPILGWAPTLKGLYLATGFSGHGLKLSPAVGECVAAAVLGRDAPFDITPLRPSRFAEGKPMYLAYGPSARA